LPRSSELANSTYNTILYWPVPTPPGRSGGWRSWRSLWGGRGGRRCSWRSLWYPVRGTSAAVKLWVLRSPQQLTAGTGSRASPHREPGPLLKCSWKWAAPLRRPDAYAGGARNTPEVIDDPSRLEPASKQNFPQWQWTGLYV
jgi:hypothetical protein